MNRICLSLGLLIASAGCAGDHIDISSTFRVTGEVTTDRLDGPASGSTARLTLRDLALDDSRRPEQRVIARQAVILGEPFELTRSYFWGTTVANPDDIPSTADDLSIEIELAGCQPWRRTITSSDLPVEDGTMVIGLERLELNC